MTLPYSLRGARSSNSCHTRFFFRAFSPLQHIDTIVAYSRGVVFQCHIAASLSSQPFPPSGFRFPSTQSLLFPPAVIIAFSHFIILFSGCGFRLDILPLTLLGVFAVFTQSIGAESVEIGTRYHVAYFCRCEGRLYRSSFFISFSRRDPLSDAARALETGNCPVFFVWGVFKSNWFSSLRISRPLLLPILL